MVLSRAPVMEPVIGTSATQFDATKFTWIGNGMSELTVCALLNNPDVKTMADASQHAFTLAGLGPGSDEDMFSKVVGRMFNWKSKIVSGYPGGNEEVMAIERG